MREYYLLDIMRSVFFGNPFHVGVQQLSIARAKYYRRYKMSIVPNHKDRRRATRAEQRPYRVRTKRCQDAGATKCRAEAGPLQGLKLGVADKFGDGDKAEAFAVGGFEDVGEGLKAARGVGDAVVEDDDGSGDEILFNEPADVPDRGMHGVVRVGAPENAGVAALASETDLPRPRDSARRAEEGGLSIERESLFGLLEIAEKFRVGVSERGNVTRIVVADFVSGGADRGDDIRMARGAVSDEEESGFGAVALEDVEDLRREGGMRAVIEREAHKRKARADAVNDVGRQELERGEQPKRFGPKDEGRGRGAESNEERKRIHKCTFVKEDSRC